MGLHYHFKKPSEVSSNVVIEQKAIRKAVQHDLDWDRMHQLMLNSSQRDSIGRDERKEMLRLAIVHHRVNTVEEASKFLNVAPSTVSMYLKELHKSLPLGH